MNSKRRAELQRKLTLSAVPRPPAGLAERIKADIPEVLDVDIERGRFSRSVAFNMRVAASILLLVTSLAVGLVLIDRPAATEKLATAAPGPFAPAPRALPPAATASAATEEVRLDIAQDTAVAEVPQVAMAAPQAQSVARLRAEEVPLTGRADREKDEVQNRLAENGVERGVVGGVVGGLSDDMAARQPVASVAQAPAAPAPQAEFAPEPPPAAPPAATMGDRSMSRMARSEAISVVPEARAAKTSFAPKDDVFGISVDPRAFQEIRATLQAGRRPAASSVDVEALVNYFAGPPSRRPKRGLALDVEASPAVIEAEGDHALLRFTVDAPAADTSAGSIPPVASDVRVEVVFNDDVVSKATRIGGAGPLARESVLFLGTSVTALYALELQAPVGEAQILATVSLS